ncbi:putative nitrogen permease regulator 2 [Rosellinia necatrix]|uniref:Putative nitrogen permease regulator 2 n=1 Tax=Rosellinia necatrix TaxID=77044 RepID=A0A1W2TSV4_ROSNE|nr:putative nitrogen permease regulator 2 [Rosellinia necatrix]
MERQNGYLSDEGHVDDGRRPIESLLEIVKEDLNNYGECMIPLDDANTINMKLFPYQAPPAPVHGWHVPVPKTKLAEIVDSTWDLTLQRILPHVDGVNDVRRIAWLADVSLPLTQCALQHLLYYDTILLLDMFFFGSCYAPRPGIHDFVANRGNLIDECAAYVWISPPPPSLGDSGGGSGGGGGADDSSLSASFLHLPHGDLLATTPTAAGSRPATSSSSSAAAAAMASAGFVRPSHYQLIRLMTTFCVGRSVMEWVRLHQETGGLDVLRHVDVRRLVQFGVVKGLLHRVHKYAVSKAYLALLATGRRPELGNQNQNDPQQQAATSRKERGDRKGKAGAKAKAKGKGKGKGREGGGGSGSVGVGAGGSAKSPEDDALEMKFTGRRLSSLRIHDEVTEEEEDEEDGDEEGGDEEDSNGDAARDGDAVGSDGESDDDGDGARVGKTRRKMQRYLDGRHSFDQIITEQNLTDADILRKLKCFEPGDVAVMYR